MNGIVKSFEDYKLFARAEIPVILFTVMLWSALQTIVGIVVETQAPDIKPGQIAVMEIMIASIGLWWVQRTRKNGGG